MGSHRVWAGLAGGLVTVTVVVLLVVSHTSAAARVDLAGRDAHPSVPSRVPRTPAREPSSVAATTTSAPSPPAPAGPPYAVQGQTIVFVDPGRATPARGPVAAKPGRVLRTIIRRPAGVSGPLPLVVFAHGFDSEPEVYEPLLDAWASAGYMVAAPECPGSARDLPGDPVPDYAAQARDISFVITSLLGGNAGAVDPGEIAVAGHSDGGTAVTIMALNAAYADARVKAYLNLAGQIPPDVEGPWATRSTPGALLVAVGDDDQYGNLALSTAMFDTAKMPKALLTVPGGDHLDTFVAPSPTAQAVRAATTRFLGAVFAGGAPALTPAQIGDALTGSGTPLPFSVRVGD